MLIISLALRLTLKMMQNLNKQLLINKKALMHKKMKKNLIKFQIKS